MKNNNWYKKEKPFATLAGMGGGATSLISTSSASEKLYVDNVFSTFLYDGGSGDKTINNGIDMTEGGLFWSKQRSDSVYPGFWDTERGVTKRLRTDNSDGESTAANLVKSFNNNGVTISSDGGTQIYDSGETHASWTFRKAPGFFDVVTFSPTEYVSNHRVSHSLGCIPGLIILKNTLRSEDWYVYHRSLGRNKYIRLNNTAGQTASTNAWGTSDPTSTDFGFNTSNLTSGMPSTYVAYLFAHDEQTFGDSADQSIIKCDSYTSNNGGALEVNVGFEPQFLIVKNTARGSNWALLDVMRGMDVADPDDHPVISVNQDYAEQDVDEDCSPVPTTTGFKMAARSGGYAEYNFGTDEIIYIAIRRSDGYVGKPPELGTDVFAMDTGNSSSTGPVYDSNFAVDWALWRQPASSQDWRVHARLTGEREILTNSTAAEGSRGDDADDDFSDGWGRSTNGSYPRNSNYQSWMWKRYAGCDVVTYIGNGSGGRLINHSINKAPEMMWIKNRTTAGYDWAVYHKGLNGGSSPEDYWIKLNSNSAEADDNGLWNDTAPTSTVFKIGTASAVNRLDDNFIAMLFASVNGISKIGYYTGDTNTEKTISDVGFQPRFILIRAASISFDWHVFDTLRGMTGSGNDARLYLNTNAAQNSDDDYITALSSGGFTVGSPGQGLNGNGVRYIYYAHA